MARMIAFRQDGNKLRQFEYQRDNTTYLDSYWSVFLKSNFFSQPWMVVLGQSKAEVLDPYVWQRRNSIIQESNSYYLAEGSALKGHLPCSSAAIFQADDDSGNCLVFLRPPHHWMLNQDFQWHCLIFFLQGRKQK